MLGYLVNPFVCKTCCKCCNGYGGAYVDFFDIEVMSVFFNISKKKIIDRYTLSSSGRLILSQKKGGLCIFLSKNSGCLIHKIKPKTCRVWPFMFSVLLDIDNWRKKSTICKGIKYELDKKQVREFVINFIKKNPQFYL